MPVIQSSSYRAPWWLPGPHAQTLLPRLLRRPGAPRLFRERIATPGDKTVLKAHHALAWNPSIVGAKSEDTIIIDDSGFEVLTWGDYPTLDVNVGGQVIQRANILSL